MNPYLEILADKTKKQIIKAVKKYMKGNSVITIDDLTSYYLWNIDAKNKPKGEALYAENAV